MEKPIQRCSFVAIVVIVVFVCFAFISQGYGAINWWGDVRPPDPSSWTKSTDAYIGKYADGGISITEGDNIEADEAYLGYAADASGIATIDGAGSSWNCGSGLRVGSSGQGTLEISNGGSVNVEEETWVARYVGSIGQINFNNGTLTTGGIFAASADLTGTGVINTHGIVSDIDLLFDSTHGTNQTTVLDSHPGQNITINLSQDS
ncbi:MAG: hypothetical protein J7L99_01765, partial [Planctomycetes bacterium]|nr:hypothetical protein [Planctomycetota bacterium]